MIDARSAPSGGLVRLANRLAALGRGTFVDGAAKRAAEEISQQMRADWAGHVRTGHAITTAAAVAVGPVVHIRNVHYVRFVDLKQRAGAARLYRPLARSALRREFLAHAAGWRRA